MSEAPDLRTRLYLVKNGVPFDVAMSWPDDWVLAAFVIIGEHEGGEWDWSTRQWKEPERA